MEASCKDIPNDISRLICPSRYVECPRFVLGSNTTHPAAPCIDDTTLQYNRLTTDVEIDLIDELEGTVQQLPLFKDMVLSEIQIIDEGFRFTILEDSLLFKSGVVVTLLTAN